ncbi:MAG: hypothetical protein COB02_13700 [Candidatus Cloacimonadota bacterium]|nr:MAG: hypothetical protein COB02_13700 [Candidatus Cloacimonadota bacterium]
MLKFFELQLLFFVTSIIFFIIYLYFKKKYSDSHGIHMLLNLAKISFFFIFFPQTPLFLNTNSPDFFFLNTWVIVIFSYTNYFDIRYGKDPTISLFLFRTFFISKTFLIVFLLLLFLPKSGEASFLGGLDKTEKTLNTERETPFYLLSTRGIQITNYLDYFLIFLLSKNFGDEFSFETNKSSKFQIETKNSLGKKLSENANLYAILSAYKLLNKKIKYNISTKVSEIYDSTKFHKKEPIKLGDLIVEINNKKVRSKSQVFQILKSYNKKHIKIKIIRNKKNILINHHLNQNYSKEYSLGFDLLDNIRFEIPKKIKILTDNVIGNSRGLALALHVYFSNSLSKINNNIKIAITGTIDENGEVNAVGGLYLKTILALKKKCDYLILPKSMTKEYSSTFKKINKKKYPHKIKVYFVNNLKEAVDFLNPILKN